MNTKPVIGRPVSDAEQKQLADLQALFKPADAFNRVDEFAKWIFSSIAVVGTLAAGLSTLAFPKLVGAGRLLLAIAILLIGLSLFASTFALQPQWEHANVSSRLSLLNAVDANLRRRRLPLQIAAALFALALVLAGAAPLASVVTIPRNVMLTYEWKPDGKLAAQLTGVGLKAGSPVELSVDTSRPASVQRTARKVADETGKAEASVEFAVPLPPKTVLNLTGRWADSAEPDAPLLHRQVLEVRVPASPQSVTLTYEWKPGGKLSAQLTGVGLSPYAPVEVSVETATAAPLEQILAHKVADANGKAEASAEFAVPFPPRTALRLEGRWADSAEPDASLNHKQILSINVPVPIPSSVPTRKTEKGS